MKYSKQVQIRACAETMGASLPSPSHGDARCCGMAVKSASDNKFPNERARRARNGNCCLVSELLSELQNGSDSSEGLKSESDWLARIKIKNSLQLNAHVSIHCAF
jgi:hypothetical protein